MSSRPAPGDPTASVEALPPEGKLASTVAALAAPRRLIPITVVCVPLVVVQQRYSSDPRAAAVGVAMCVAFVLAAPFLWRWLEPTQHRRWSALARLALYGLGGALIVGVVGWLGPRALGVGPTFLTGRESLAVSMAMFWVGGWGLGRDIDHEVDLLRARARAGALEREAERAQLLALRSQLDPHFLFNTLNAIAEWCREDGAVAEAALLELSGMLRTMLGGVKAGSWPLAREIELVDALVSLHRIRDPEALSLRRSVPAELLARPVPPMILLPLVENGVKHGPAAGHRGELRLEVREREAGGSLELVLDNPGPFGGRRPGGEGLAMVERRLALAYGDRAGLDIGSLPPEGPAQGELPRTRVRIWLPAGPPQMET